MSHKSYKTSGLILRRFPLNEADLIVTLLTPELGKLHCIAKGARRMQSKFLGSLELLSETAFNLHEGRSLEHVNEVELLECLSVTKPSLEMAGVLFYMAELTHKLIQDSQHVEGAYALLKESLQHLSVSEGRADAGLCETLLHTYIIKLFTLLGFMPSWDTCTNSGEKLNLNAPLYLCASDFSVVPQEYAEYNDRRLTPTLIKWVNFMQKYPLPAILQVRITGGERMEVMSLLDLLMGSVLSSPLQSQQFFREVRA